MTFEHADLHEIAELVAKMDGEVTSRENDTAQEEYETQVEPDSRAMTIVPRETKLVPVSLIVDIDEAERQYNQFVEFVKRILKDGLDFGKIPGVDKPTLLLPGAEKLANCFGISVEMTCVEKKEDWQSEPPFFFYRYRATARSRRDGTVIAECFGSSNSMEQGFHYRTANRVCPSCGKDTIIQGKKEFGGGWLCWKKKGGCGAKFGNNDPAITGQEHGKKINEFLADQTNAIDKRAQKRAYVGCVKLATNASSYFTVDVEDGPPEMYGGGDASPTTPAPHPSPTEEKKATPAPPASPSPASPSQDNGKYITNQQRRLMFKVAKDDGGYDHAAIKEILSEDYGIDSTAKIPKSMFDDIMARLSGDPGPDPLYGQKEPGDNTQ